MNTNENQEQNVTEDAYVYVKETRRGTVFAYYKSPPRIVVAEDGYSLERNVGNKGNVDDFADALMYRLRAMRQAVGQAQGCAQSQEQREALEGLLGAWTEAGVNWSTGQALALRVISGFACNEDTKALMLSCLSQVSLKEAWGALRVPGTRKRPPGGPRRRTSRTVRLVSPEMLPAGLRSSSAGA